MVFRLKHACVVKVVARAYYDFGTALVAIVETVVHSGALAEQRRYKNLIPGQIFRP